MMLKEFFVDFKLPNSNWLRERMYVQRSKSQLPLRKLQGQRSLNLPGLAFYHSGIHCTLSLAGPRKPLSWWSLFALPSDSRFWLKGMIWGCLSASSHLGSCQIPFVFVIPEWIEYPPARCSLQEPTCALTWEMCTALCPSPFVLELPFSNWLLFPCDLTGQPSSFGNFLPSVKFCRISIFKTLASNPDFLLSHVMAAL